MTIQYDAGLLTGWCGLLRLLMRWHGTVLHGAILGPMFWPANLLHVSMLVAGGRIPIYIRTNSTGTSTSIPENEWERWDGIDLPPLDWRAAIVGLTLLFFFIVFYGNSSYQRFYFRNW